jgi:hypothetical protein
VLKILNKNTCLLFRGFVWQALGSFVLTADPIYPFKFIFSCKLFQLTCYSGCVWCVTSSHCDRRNNLRQVRTRYGRAPDRCSAVTVSTWLSPAVSHVDCLPYTRVGQVTDTSRRNVRTEAEAIIKNANIGRLYCYFTTMFQLLNIWSAEWDVVG